MAGLISLATAALGSTPEKRADVALFEYNEKDELVRNASGGVGLRFQYFPDTISDSKAVNYQQQAIPGGSLPLYQWINSGERVISFTAYFTSDVDLLAKGQGRALSIAARLKGAGVKSRSPDIRSALVWLRRLVLPRYGTVEVQGTGVPITYPPRKLLLVIPNSGIGMYGGDSGFREGVAAHSVWCILTQCEFNFVSFFPSGFPRIVTANLAFSQIAQRGDGVVFPSATQSMDGAVSGFTQPFLGYNLRSATKFG
jgi:hypothetical protein